ncbi:MAG: hypothetical protein L0Y71_25935 [Gemmataceae bacterium]|nr:hypothetical protein [Gemmataceae bacterium]
MSRIASLISGIVCGAALITAGIEEAKAQSSGSEKSPGGRYLAPAQGPTTGAAAERDRLLREKARLEAESERMKHYKAQWNQVAAELKKARDLERAARIAAIKYQLLANAVRFRCPNGHSWGDCTHTDLKRDFLRRRADLEAESRFKVQQADRLERLVNVNVQRLRPIMDRLNSDARAFRRDVERYEADVRDWQRRYLGNGAQTPSSGRGFGYDENGQKGFSK